MALASRQGRPDAPRLTRGVLNSLGFEDSPGSLPGRGPRHVIFKELLACITCLNSIRFSRFRRERLRSACRLPPLGLISGARKYITLAPPPRQPPISEFPKKVFNGLSSTPAFDLQQLPIPACIQVVESKISRAGKPLESSATS